MAKLRILMTSVVGVALIGGSITPAFARHGDGWGNGWGGGGYRHRRHDRVDAGDVIAGIFVIGVIAAIASSASKSKKRTEDSRANSDEDWRRDKDRSNSDDRSTNDERATAGKINSEDAAVDACAKAAEERAGDAASVRDIANVSRSGDGWDVNGSVEQRDGWRDRSTTTTKFSCSVRFGRVESVYLGDKTAALD
jgi:hypothetical protein